MSRTGESKTNRHEKKSHQFAINHLLDCVIGNETVHKTLFYAFLLCNFHKIGTQNDDSFLQKFNLDRNY